MTNPQPLTKKDRFELEALEPRLLLSADVMLVSAVSQPTDSSGQSAPGKQVIEVSAQGQVPMQAAFAYNPADQVDDIFAGVTACSTDSVDSSADAENTATGVTATGSAGEVSAPGAPAEAPLPATETATSAEENSAAPAALAGDVLSKAPASLPAAVVLDPTTSALPDAGISSPLADQLTETLKGANGPPSEAQPYSLLDSSSSYLGYLALVTGDHALTVFASGDINLSIFRPDFLQQHGIRSLTIQGSDSTDDTLHVDLSHGDLPLDVTFHGGDGGFDTLIIGGASSGSYTPGKVFGDGVFQSCSTRLDFTGLEPVIVDGTGVAGGTFTFTTSSTGAGNDLLTIDSPAAGQNRISGTSGGVTFESVTFSSYLHVIIDTGTNDQAGANQDEIHLTSALVASALLDLTISTGAGNDSVDLDGLGLTNSVAVTLTLGTGDNTLKGPAAGGSWNFTGEASGSLIVGTGTGTVQVSGATIITPRGEAGFQLGSASADTLTSVSSDPVTGTTGNESLTGLTGDDAYVFLNNFGTDTVVEGSGAGTDTLDFSAVTANLSDLLVLNRVA